jgi:hypothetical protein
MKMTRRYEESEMDNAIDKKRNKFIQENNWISNVEEFLKKKELKVRTTILNHS